MLHKAFKYDRIISGIRKEYFGLFIQLHDSLEQKKRNGS